MLVHAEGLIRGHEHRAVAPTAFVSPGRVWTWLATPLESPLHCHKPSEDLRLAVGEVYARHLAVCVHRSIHHLLDLGASDSLAPLLGTQGDY